MSEKLQKILANAGLGSRREMETWIESGRVSVNGELASLGDRATHVDQIRVDGRLIRTKPHERQRTRVIIYNKPEGEICSRDDPEGRPTVFECLPNIRAGRWISIGRLDINTNGLLLFTNDGELANLLMHPSSEIEREYAVRVLGEVDKKILTSLRTGVKLDDGMAAFDEVSERGGEGANQWYHVVLKEGRQREVRRLWESQGVKVSRLIRVRFGNIELPRELRRGRWEELSVPDVNRLKSLVGLVELPEDKPKRRQSQRRRTSNKRNRRHD
ncbi:MAG: 23S rRNA pseudouridine(2605) synthase RluB [Legionellales bacterium]|nr:23S rRNA pseudouridine(2605) synthase RluB [Legionellales bacterium]|tara:strand:+ start:1603 stop:2418 length:816 start_codon:yes stop_codon:yes gene_type:complete